MKKQRFALAWLDVCRVYCVNGLEREGDFSNWHIPAGTPFPDHLRSAEATSHVDLSGSAPVFFVGIGIICCEYKSGILHFLNLKYVFERIDD